ncbi:dihydroneopterin aldolase [Alicyclobacillus curvatus]|nr:dihydroneopterin aldolase [Alicyclobacillus curvatus]
MDSIRMTGMVFFGYHGVFAEEQRIGQRFYVNAELYLDLKAAVSSDNVSDTVDYGQVYDIVRGIVEGEPKKLIEAVAGEIASRVFAQFTQVARVVVEVIKPSAPVPGIFDQVSVCLDRNRDEAATSVNK